MAVSEAHRGHHYLVMKEPRDQNLYLKTCIYCYLVPSQILWLAPWFHVQIAEKYM